LFFGTLRSIRARPIRFPKTWQKRKTDFLTPTYQHLKELPFQIGEGKSLCSVPSEYLTRKTEKTPPRARRAQTSWQIQRRNSRNENPISRRATDEHPCRKQMLNLLQSVRTTGGVSEL
jgi:hypothetical protein